MKRSDFLKRIGLAVGAIAAMPAVALKAIRGKGIAKRVTPYGIVTYEELKAIKFFEYRIESEAHEWDVPIEAFYPRYSDKKHIKKVALEILKHQ